MRQYHLKLPVKQDEIKKYVDDEPQYTGPSIREKASKFIEKQKIQSARRQRERYEKQSVKMAKMQQKIDLESKKTELAVLKAKRREASPLHKALQRIPSKMTERPSRELSAQHKGIRLAEKQLRMEQKEFDKIRQEREYHEKYPVRQAGDGELPYYEPEHLKPLPVKPPVKRKTMREELVGGLDDLL